ncbi:MAG: tRNA (adenosine(37)-N6)-threonylcarbamoyltransferase complex transferase subunit TsaD [Deltaproteobacteria bacterium]|nr:MAG: tRNA (adenosine(37)-N6)-threonylcarbamoyltransferase complex transferase subunit TsaD [Deltaproteobacteria bacterium]
MRFRYLLAIESSCDDSGIAILDENGIVQVDALCSFKDYSLKLGGIVPEIAARHHIAIMSSLLESVLAKSHFSSKYIDVIAVTHRPGIIGSLLVGVSFAKGLSSALNIPLLGINHIEGHLFCGYGESNFVLPPFIGVIVSGGHSSIYLCDEKYNLKMIGDTKDDAAGEILDKVGRMLGLRYPAGKMIDYLAKHGVENNKIKFPNMTQEALDYSFSGLKTAVGCMLDFAERTQERFILSDFCFEFQRHIMREVLNKAKIACKAYGISKLVFGGGVVANSFLRQELSNLSDLSVYIPLLKDCTDNAIMIGKAAVLKLRTGKEISEDFFVFSH